MRRGWRVWRRQEPAAQVCPTFSDAALQARFEAEGYIIVPLLSEDEIDGLTEFVTPLIPDDCPAFLAPKHGDTAQLRRQVDEGLRRLLVPAVQRLLPDHDCFRTGLLVKPSGLGDTGVLGMHQDWNFVDERRYASLAAWVPLVDTGPDNGGLEVVPGSHRVGFNHRGPNLPGAFDQVKELLGSRTVQAEVPAGHALCFDNRLLHGSGGNHGDVDRLVVAAGMMPRDAELIHFYRGDDGAFRRYRLEPEYFVLHDIEAEPVGRGVLGYDTVEPAVLDLGPDDLDRLLPAPAGPVGSDLDVSAGRR